MFQYEVSNSYLFKLSPWCPRRSKTMYRVWLPPSAIWLFRLCPDQVSVPPGQVGARNHRNWVCHQEPMLATQREMSQWILGFPKRYMSRSTNINRLWMLVCQLFRHKQRSPTVKGVGRVSRKPPAPLR
jgi:hypothetical protein